MSVGPPRAQIALSARARSLEEAHALGASLFYPHVLTPLGPKDDVGLVASAARLGPVTAGVLEYSSGIRIDTGEYGSAVQVNVPLFGSLKTTIGDEHVRATNRIAAVYPHDVPTIIAGWDSPLAMLAVKLDRLTVERRLQQYEQAVDLHGVPTLDVRTGPSADWVAAVRRVIATAQRLPAMDEGLVRFLADRCIDGLVLALTADPSSPSSTDAATDQTIVDRAREAITYSSGPLLSLHDLSQYVGVNARSLQLSFKRVLGQTPMQVQRRERLHRVARELKASAHGVDRVQTIALKHGFTHLGRFSAEYERTFGELPSRTLAR
ncbi:hypothetical protein DBR36_07105 [Microbacterium sp. HMWF026]|nr:hypothetical protein DBR36_07105 [Microbacterium sp. HMWF026]